MDGKAIAEKRKELGLTQEELGTMLGMSGKAVSKWERGLSKPCDEHLAQLVNLLGLPVESPISTNVKHSNPHSTFISTIRKEFIRILATGAMLAASLCNLTGAISTDSTVVSLGYSVTLFNFETLAQSLRLLPITQRQSFRSAEAERSRERTSAVGMKSKRSSTSSMTIITPFPILSPRISTRQT